MSTSKVNQADLALWHAWRKRRSDEAFESLVRPHLGFMADLALRRARTTSDADDLVQQALTRLAKETTDRPIEIGLRAWLGRHIVLDAKMSHRAASRRSQHEQMAPPVRTIREHDLDARDEVAACLRELPAPQREAVVLRYLHDLEYTEMAYVTGASVNACRLRVHKGIERMRVRLGTKVGALVAALPLLGGEVKASVIRAALTAPATKLGAVAAAGGLIAMKKTAVMVAVLLGVAGTFYSLGSTTEGKRVARADEPSERVKTPVRNVAPREKPAAPKPNETHLTEHEAQSPISMIQHLFEEHAEGQATIAPRAKILERRAEWKPLTPETMKGSPTGLKLSGKFVLPNLDKIKALKNVYELELRNCALTDAHLENIAHLQSLLILRLDGTQITDAGLATIAKLTSLVHLSLRNTKVTARGIETLKELVYLESLDLPRGILTESLIPKLAEFPRLAKMWLPSVRLTRESLDRLAAMPNLKALRVEFFPKGALVALAGSRTLEHLDLSDGDISDEDFASLGGMQSLRRLDLAETTFRARHLRHLAGLKNLEDLNLKETRLNDDALGQLEGLSAIKILRLDETGITDEGVARLAGLTSLQRLDIDENNITDAAIPYLVGLKSLRLLDIKDTKITDAGAATLAKALPRCMIRR